MTKELTIVWQRARDSVWEEEWVEYLFQNIPHKTIENLNHDLFIDNSVIVDAICWAPYHNKYIAELKSKGYKFGLVHLTDESRGDDISSYNDCRFVLRNYYRDNVPNNVMHVPLGWNTGFTKTKGDLSSFNRTNLWGFVGARWDQNRNDMANVMSNVPGGKIYVANHHGPRLSPEQMSGIYKNTIFIPCPRGALVIDSFRVTEAFEAGCIPIVEKSNYWTQMYGPDFPAIQINHWGEAPGIIERMLVNVSAVEAFRLRCKLWWESKKHSTVKNVTELFHKTMV